MNLLAGRVRGGSTRSRGSSCSLSRTSRSWRLTSALRMRSMPSRTRPNTCRSPSLFLHPSHSAWRWCSADCVLCSRARVPARSTSACLRSIGLTVGWGSVAVGIAGVLFHLDSAFFEEQTLKNLVYTAPFAAPLAYTGIGLLLLLNRMIDSRTIEWARWVVLLAMGGFAGNFVLTLADHAQNGFFRPSEWIGVVAKTWAGILLSAAHALFRLRQPPTSGPRPRGHGGADRGGHSWVFSSCHSRPPVACRADLGPDPVRGPAVRTAAFRGLGDAGCTGPMGPRPVTIQLQGPSVMRLFPWHRAVVLEVPRMRGVPLGFHWKTSEDHRS